MLEEGRIWKDMSLHPGMHPEYINLYGMPCEGNPHTYKIDGDTVINGKSYKKFLKDGSPISVFMRQEGTRIYKCEPDSYPPEWPNPEELAYDFGLQERDTIYYPHYEFGLVVDHVDTITVDGISRRRLTMNMGLGEDEIETLADIWVEGIGGAATSPLFYWSAWMTSTSGMMRSCIQDRRVLFSWGDFFAPGTSDADAKKCATPAIAYDNGRLMFSSDTPGAECVYKIKCADEGSGRGSEVSLSQTYEIRVHATLDGYEDSDVATATIGWRNGRPVMEGFSSVTLDDGDGNGDVNGDGKVDVADISTVISIMAGQEGCRLAE
jgi:hypothetical protein